MANYLDVPTASGASTPDQAGLASGTSTYDLRVECAANDWTNSYQTFLCYDSGGGADRWAFYINGSAVFEHYFTNTSGSPYFANSTVALPTANGASVGVRVLHAVAAGTMDFYTSSDFSSWTPLGTQITGLSTLGMKTAGSSPVVRLGNDFFSEPLVGKFTKVRVIVGGSTILDWDITTATVGTGPWTATTGETWTRFGTASVISAGGGGGGGAATGQMMLTGVGS